MANTELTGILAFYGSILLGKMGLMSLLTARQRFRKMVPKKLHIQLPYICQIEKVCIIIRSFPLLRILLQGELSPMQTLMWRESTELTRMTLRTSPFSCLLPTFTWHPTPQLLWHPTWFGYSLLCGSCIRSSTWMGLVANEMNKI